MGGHDACPCTSRAACARGALWLWFRNALLGSGARTALSVLALLVGRWRGRGRGAGRAVVWRSLVDLRTGSFLGTYTAAVRAASCTLSRWRGVRDSAVSLLAGAVGGVASVLLPAEERATLALYSAVRAGHALTIELYNRRLLPARLLAFEHADVALMCVATSQILYAYIFVPESLPRAYLGFLNHHGQKPRELITFLTRELRGLPLDYAELAAYCQSVGLSLGADVCRPDGIPLYCHLAHPDCGHVTHLGRNWLEGVRRAFNLYATVHTGLGLVLLLLRLFKRWRSARAAAALARTGSATSDRGVLCEPADAAAAAAAIGAADTGAQPPKPVDISAAPTPAPVRSVAPPPIAKQGLTLPALWAELQHSVWTVARNITFSTLFLSTYCMVPWAVSLCIIVNRLHLRNLPIHRLLLSLSGLTLLLEHKSRRLEMALYCLPRAALSLVSELSDTYKIGSRPALWTLLGCVASALMVRSHQQQPEHLGANIRWALDALM